MQYIHKCIFGPKDLKQRKNKFYKMLKNNKIYTFNKKKLNEETINKIYKYYNEHKFSDSINFNTSQTKKNLLKSSKYRCCFCGRYISDSNDNDCKELSIEHFKPESIYPLNILDWNNLLPICKECNKNRDNKILNFPKPPSSLYFKKYLKYLIYLSQGYIELRENIQLKSVIDVYNLNSKELTTQRKNFYYQIINPNFKTLLLMETEKNNYLKKAIIFIDEYLTISKYLKRKSTTNKCELYKIYKEVISDE